MKRGEIFEKIRIILESEKREETLKYVQKTSEQLSPQLIYEIGQYEFRSKNIDLLRVLLNKLSSDNEKTMFWIGLSGFATKSWPLFFEFYFRTGKIEKACDKLFKDFTLNQQSLSMLEWLSKNLAYESHIFNDELLHKLNDYMRELKYKKIQIESKSHGVSNLEINLVEWSPELKSMLQLLSDQINKIQVSRLKQELLEGVNWEINQDKEQVQEKLKHFGFSDELSQCLDEFEKDYAKAETDFDFKSCIGHVRSFSETLNQELVRKIETKTGIKFKGSYESTGSVRSYFTKSEVNFLTQNECSAHKSIWDLSSDVGVHKLTSRKEFARVIKNIAIEVAVLSLERLEKYLDGKE